MPLYRSPDLSDGQHTLTITLTNPTNVPSNRNGAAPYFMFDFFLVRTASVDVAVRNNANIIIDDTDSGVSYSDGWTRTFASYELLGTTHRSPTDRDGTITYTFTGTSIAVYGTIHDKYGNTPLAYFYMDDSTTGTPFTANGLEALRPHTRLFDSGTLSNGQHRIRIQTLAGQKNWWFDYFMVTPNGVVSQSNTGSVTVDSPEEEGSGGGGGSGSGSSSATSGSATSTPSSADQSVVAPIVIFSDGQPITTANALSPGVGSNGPTRQSGPDRTAIIAGVLGGLLGLTCLLLAIFLFRKWMQKRRQMVGHQVLDEQEAKSRETKEANSIALGTVPSSRNLLSPSLSGTPNASRQNLSPYVVPGSATPTPLKGTFQRAPTEISGTTSGSGDRNSVSDVSISVPPLSPTESGSQQPVAPVSKQTPILKEPPGLSSGRVTRATSTPAHTRDSAAVTETEEEQVRTNRTRRNVLSQEMDSGYYADNRRTMPPPPSYDNLR
ncbi:hypothetical protein CPB86DRAFT_790913 [Serendipita vermifera]|nr:hypothetical protein CPB86DRAFT_790913 [Serendipita vermifera]